MSSEHIERLYEGYSMRLKSHPRPDAAEGWDDADRASKVRVVERLVDADIPDPEDYLDDFLDFMTKAANELEKVGL